MNSAKFAFDAIGTSWEVAINDSNDISLFEIEKAIKDRIEAFDKTYSRFRHDSLIYQASQKEGVYLLPHDAQELFSTYKKLYDVTQGTFTPLIGDVLIEAGYDADYSLQTKKLHHPPRWEDIIDFSFPELVLKKPAMLDFGAGGKGYIVDIIGRILTEYGINSFVVDASGDILYKDRENQAFRIGLEHPENPTQVIGVATITEGSLCGSAGNRRRWDNYHHIISPKTLTSPTNILSVWTVAKTALMADSLATALFLTDPDSLTSTFEFEYAIVKDDYRVEKSLKFPEEFFYS